MIIYTIHLSTKLPSIFIPAFVFLDIVIFFLVAFRSDFKSKEKKTDERQFGTWLQTDSYFYKAPTKSG